MNVKYYAVHVMFMSKKLFLKEIEVKKLKWSNIIIVIGTLNKIWNVFDGHDISYLIESCMFNKHYLFINIPDIVSKI